MDVRIKAIQMIVSTLMMTLMVCRIQAAEPGVYVATEIRVIDGDTFATSVEVWPDVTLQLRVRLRGVDAPELNSKIKCEREWALMAKSALKRFLTNAHQVTIQRVHVDKYGGRYDADVEVDDVDLSALLLAENVVRKTEKTRGGTWCE